MTRLPQRGTLAPGQSESQPPTVAIALFVGFVLAAAFTGLAAIVIPRVLFMVLAGIGMLIFFALQYFLWAKWLYPIVMKMEADSSMANEASADTIPARHSEIDS